MVERAGDPRETEERRPIPSARSVVLAGVGGQGAILATNMLARVMLAHGCDVKTSEVHGMAQRGGGVVSAVRFGESVLSPLVPEGEAEAVIATEMLEALRCMAFLAPGGRMIVARTRIDPLSVLQGASEYPEDVEDMIREHSKESVFVDAVGVAAGAGDARAANTVLLGTYSRFIDVPLDTWLAVFEEVLSAKALEVNREAFLRGRDLV